MDHEAMSQAYANALNFQILQLNNRISELEKDLEDYIIGYNDQVLLADAFANVLAKVLINFNEQNIADAGEVLRIWEDVHARFDQ